MKNVVLIDDYEQFVQLEKEVIEMSCDANCVIFFNPLKALEYLKKKDNIDIVISDYQMPQMNGFELAQKIIDLYPKIDIVITSGHDVTTLKKIRADYNLGDKVKVIMKGNMKGLTEII